MVDAGPYAFVRHPGYVAGIVAILGFPLVIGSTLAFGPVLLGATVLIIRTALEDHTLREKLPGYSEYATRVRWRLVPHIW